MNFESIHWNREFELIHENELNLQTFVFATEVYIRDTIKTFVNICKNVNILCMCIKHIVYIYYTCIAVQQ